MTLRAIQGGDQAVRGMGLADYIWLDGAGNIHVKKKAIYLVMEVGTGDVVPVLEPWVATVTYHNKETERILLNPAHYLPDPLRGPGNFVCLCEARAEDNQVHPTNTRSVLRQVVEATKDPHGTWWGFRQGYTFTDKPGKEHYIAAERHLCACLDAGLFLHSGQVDAPSGNWSFKVGPRAFPDVIDKLPPSAATVPDNLIFGRYFLEKIARENGFGLEYTNCSVYYSTAAVRSPVDPEDPQTLADIVQAKIKFPKGSPSRLSWVPNTRVGIAGPTRIATGGGFSFIEDRGLDPMADPYITVARIVDALGGLQ